MNDYMESTVPVSRQTDASVVVLLSAVVIVLDDTVSEMQTRIRVARFLLLYLAMFASANMSAKQSWIVIESFDGFEMIFKRKFFQLVTPRLLDGVLSNLTV